MIFPKRLRGQFFLRGHH